MRSLLIFVLSLGLVEGAVAAGTANSMFSDMMRLTDTTTARISSFDRSGGNTDYRPIAPGETLDLAEMDGAGIVRHLYFSIWGSEHYLKDLVLRAYWDGNDEPCVEVPFGDFFGLGHERTRFFTSLMVTVNPGDLGVYGTYGFNSYFPMPYADGARFTLTNEGKDPIVAVWYHIEYERMDRLPENLGRFHASWNQERPTKAVGEVTNRTLHEAYNETGDENYVLLDAEGHGNVAGIFLNIDNRSPTSMWYGEGDDMIFIDGEDWPPSYHGTGSEEIFGGGACPTDEYDGPYTGFHLIGNLDWRGKVSMYRFYVNDPIRFKKSIRMTIEHGHANNFGNDYSSTVFWYQDEPHKKFNPLPPPDERHPRVGDDPHDQAYKALISLRPKVFSVWLNSIQNNWELPQDVIKMVRDGVSKSYFKRNYERMHKELKVLEQELDELIEERDI